MTTATLDDLRDLRLIVEVSGPEILTEDQQKRLLDHVDTAIRVREAQKTKSRTDWHAERLTAFTSAMLRWRAECEEYAIGHGTEIADFKREHPKPRLLDFTASDRPANVCPTCGSMLGD